MIPHALSSRTIDRTKEGFEARDLILPTTAMNVAEITLSAPYPPEGWTMNLESTMIVLILEGEVTLQQENEEIVLLKGTTVLIETNKKYRWLPNGSVTLYVVSNPPWTSEQQRRIDM